MKNPFTLNDTASYRRWREQKLAQAITDPAQLIVRISDPAALSPSEHAALISRIERSNMAVYQTDVRMDESTVQKLAGQVGLRHLDANWLADDQGISRITVSRAPGQRQTYIPYTEQAIKWHTDGYYNPMDRQIRGMVLHCSQNAADGGENRVMDHEIAYLMLRDAHEEDIHALSAMDAMTIPARTDDTGVARAAQTGPVFSIAGGRLHMRYTARTRSILWRQDETTLAAVNRLEQLLAQDTPHIMQLKLAPGMGLLCNNVLHDRRAFTDDPARPRLLYRARYLERVAQSRPGRI
ncbi:MAG: TauD/TfdA family dioxygenase [Gallionella sp.]|nr:TauD/TfdA family dioxygenase [Gallionella sp.]